jgi:hypothetical protein
MATLVLFDDDIKGAPKKKSTTLSDIKDIIAGVTDLTVIHKSGNETIVLMTATKESSSN